MGVFELLLIGIGLSADAFSVTIANTVAYSGLSRFRKLCMPIFFGVFQGLMPVLGFFLGDLAASFIESYAGIISLVILGFIGGKMIWDALHEEDGDVVPDAKTLGYRTLFVQAVATSIDAFAVGVAFAADAVNIWAASGIIMLCTFLLCLVALLLGRKFGELLGRRAQVVGGIILILIGLKACFF